jgi:hypothetical protein
VGWLCDALMEGGNQTLSTLYVQSNGFQDDGVAWIMDALKVGRGVAALSEDAQGLPEDAQEGRRAEGWS